MSVKSILFMLPIVLISMGSALAADCSDVYPGAQETPSPDWPQNPYPGACYIDFPGGGGPTRSRYEQLCQDLPGYLHFEGDFGSNKNTCVFAMPSGNKPSPEPAPPPSVREPPVRSQEPTPAELGLVVMTFDNKTDTTLSIKMFSQQRNRIWPAPDEHWDLPAGRHGSYQLNCNIGEKICYGAFDSQNRTWSLGRYGKGQCDNCCLTCAASDENVENTWELVLAGNQRPAAGTPGSSAESLPPIDSIKTTGFKSSECSDDLPGSLFTTGPIEYSCRHTELAHLQGRPIEIKKFIGIACGRSDTDMMASANARARAKEVVFQLEIDEANRMGADRSRNEIFVTDKIEWKCVRTK